MTKSISYLLFFFMLMVYSCKPDSDLIIDEPTAPNPNLEVETIIPSGDENYLNEDSDYIFDQDKLHTFELNIPEEALAQIDADPTAEEYVEASVTFEGETISPVGVRYKGSIGAFVNCLSGNNWALPSGHKTCTKLSMKVKINWEGREEKFFKLKKLQFHSLNNDPSQMRERLGYWLFREMGVPAPRCVHARLVINGNYVGLFALVEQIDGRFTRYNFEDGKGNLYKEVWPLHSNGQPFSAAHYLTHLKTNEDENPTTNMMLNFAEEIADAPPENRQSVVEKWMNVPQIISYAVVDRTIRNDDGAFHWYCSGSTCSPHNFYWYEETAAGKMHLIPWDLDHAFENIISNENFVTPIADKWGETRNDCKPFNYGVFQFSQRSAACDKLIGAWASYTEKYEQQLEAFKNGAFSEVQVNTLLETWGMQIRPATLEASEIYGDALTIAEWERAVVKLRNKLDFARRN